MTLTALKGSAITSGFRACLWEGSDMYDCEASVAHVLHTKPVAMVGLFIAVVAFKTNKP